MSNVALATGGTYRPKGGSAFDRRRSGGKGAARPALCLAVFCIVVFGSSLSWWQSVDASDGASVAPRHLDVDAFARDDVLLGAEGYALTTLSCALDVLADGDDSGEQPVLDLGGESWPAPPAPPPASPLGGEDWPEPS